MPVRPTQPEREIVPPLEDEPSNGVGSDDPDDVESGEGDPNDDDDDDGEPAMHLASVTGAEPERDDPPRSRRGRPPKVRSDDEPDYRPMPRNPRGMRGPRTMSPEARASSPAFRHAQKQQEEAIAELDTLLAGLNFKKREYEIRVKRLSPDTDENGTPCSGMLKTYHEHVTVQQIQDRYGGGTYEVSVFGPHPSTGNVGIITRERFTIAGNPRPMQSFLNKREDESALADALRVVAETNERANDRIAEVMERSSNKQSGVSELMPMVQAMMDKTESTVNLVMEQLRQDNLRRDQERKDAEAREERRRDEQRREEERKERERREYEDKKEARAREEREAERRREEQRREDERVRREEERERREEERREEEKREAKREEERRERERELREEQKMQREAEREARREEAAEKQRQHERELAASAERTKQDAERMQQIMAMQRDNSTQMIEFLTAKMEGGGLEGMVKQVEALEYIRGDNKRPSKMEEFSEGVQTITQALAPVANQFLSGRQQGMMQQQQGQQNVQQNVQQPQGRRVLVDLPQRPALPAPQTQQPAQPATQASTQPTPPPVEPATPDEIRNDFTSFVMPSPNPDGSFDSSLVGIMLIKNLDLAIQRRMSAEEIVDKVLDPFEDAVASAPWAEMMVGMFQDMDNATLLQHIANEVVDANTKQPLNWAILTPFGSERVVQAFEIWRQVEDDDGVPEE